MRLDFSCESSAKQRIHLKHQVFFLWKTKEEYLWMSSAAVVIGTLRVKMLIGYMTVVDSFSFILLSGSLSRHLPRQVPGLWLSGRRPRQEVCRWCQGYYWRDREQGTTCVMFHCWVNAKLWGSDCLSSGIPSEIIQVVYEYDWDKYGRNKICTLNLQIMHRSVPHHGHLDKLT